MYAIVSGTSNHVGALMLTAVLALSCGCAEAGEASPLPELRKAAELLAQAEAPGLRTEKRRLYDRVIAEFSHSRNAELRGMALRALVAKAKLPGDDRVALLDRAIALADRVDNATFAKDATAAAILRGVLSDDDAATLRSLDIILEQGLLRAAEIDGTMLCRLQKVLTAKSEMTGDPDVEIRYYDEIVALDASPLATAAALLAKTRERLAPGEEAALYRRIIADYGDSPDDRLQKAVAKARFATIRLAADAAERIRRCDVVIARYGDAADAELRRLAAMALLIKANNSNAREELLRLYAETIDLCQGFETDREMRECLVRAIQRRDRLMGVDTSLERQYDEWTTACGVGPDCLDLLYEKALLVRYDLAGLKAFDQHVPPEFLNSDDPGLRRLLLPIKLKMAERLDDKAAKMRIYDDIISQNIYPPGFEGTLLAQAYADKLALLTDPAEKIALCDQIVARYETDPEFLAPLSGKAAADRGDMTMRFALSLHGLDDMEAKNVQQTVVKALIAKADLTCDKMQKAAIYDRIIENYGGGSTDLFGSREVEQAVKAKAELLGDAAILDDFAERRMRLYPNSRETFERLAKRIDAIGDPRERTIAQDRLIERFADTEDAFVYDKIAEMLFARAAAAGAVEDKATLYDKALRIGVTIRHPPHAIGRALDKRLALTSGSEDKIRVCDWLLSLRRRSGFPYRDGFSSSISLIKAELVTDANEKIRLCDAAIDSLEKRGGFFNHLSDIAKALRIKAQASGDSSTEARYYDRVIDSSDDRTAVACAFANRVKLASALDDKLRLYDRMIDRAKCLPLRGQDIFRYLAERAQLTTDRREKLRLYDEALLHCENDADEIAAIRGKAENTDAKEEKLALYRRAYDRFGNKSRLTRNSPGFFLRSESYAPMAALIADWTRLLDNDADKLDLYSRILEAYKDAIDFDAREELRKTTHEMLALTGDRTRLLDYYDYRIAHAGNDIDAAFEYLEKARLAATPEAADAVFDAMLARFRRSRDHQVRNAVSEALKGKALRTGDLAALAAIYGDLARLARENGRSAAGELHWALMNQAAVTVDRRAAAALYDEVIAKTKKDRRRPERFAAMGLRAELADDPAERLRRYDALLNEAKKWKPPAGGGTRMAVQVNPAQLLPEYLMKKAALASDTAEKLRLYDQAIAASGSATNDTALAAMYAEIDLADTPADRLARCDRLIETVCTRGSADSSFHIREIPRALLRKAKETGDATPATIYYDAEIALAETDVEREHLTLLKVRDTGGKTETIAACDRLIGLESDPRLLSLAYMTKAQAESADPGAALAVYSDMLKAFAHDPRETIRALNAMAELAAAPDEKVALYDRILAVCVQQTVVSPHDSGLRDDELEELRRDALAGKVAALRAAE